MLAYVLIGIAVVVVVLIVVIALQPTAMTVTRSARFAAPPSAVYPHVAELRKWQPWSPWEKFDPALQRTYDGPAAGVGSSYHWVGNKKIGEGRMTITEAQPNEKLVFRLEFLKPFVATNRAEFVFVPVGEGTELTWSMMCQRNFMMKAFGLIMNMDKMVGGQFAEGLTNLKQVVESKSTQPELSHGR